MLLTSTNAEPQKSSEVITRQHSGRSWREISHVYRTTCDPPGLPVSIRGAGVARRKHGIEPATLEELDAVVAEMPKRLRHMVLLPTWCALRYGELAELRRRDST